MSMPADSRSLKRGLSRDVLTSGKESPSISVKRRRADITADETESHVAHARLDAVDEFLMGVVTHAGNTVAEQSSTSSSTMNASNTAAKPSTSTTRSSRNRGAPLPNDSEDSDNAPEDDPLPPNPPEDESFTTSTTDKSKIPCRYHTLPGGCRRRNCRFAHTDGVGHGRCYICLEDNIKIYGLLSSCNHTFCFSCAQRWRDTKTGDSSKKCPLCRQISVKVIPSSEFYPIGPERDEHTVHYKQRLSKVPCRYFEASKAKARRRCPFLNQCQFAHIVDGKPFLFTNKDVRKVKKDRSHSQPLRVDNQTTSRIRDRLRRRRPSDVPAQRLVSTAEIGAELESLRNTYLVLETRLGEETARLREVEDQPNPPDTAGDLEVDTAQQHARISEISVGLAGIYARLGRLSTLEFLGSHLRATAQTTATTTDENTIASTDQTPPSENSSNAMAIETEDARLVLTDLLISPVEETESSATVSATTNIPGSNSTSVVTGSQSSLTTRTSAVAETSNVEFAASSVDREPDLTTYGVDGQSNTGEQPSAAPSPAAISTTMTATPATEPEPAATVIDAEMVEARDRRWEELRRRFNARRGSQG